MWFSPSLSAEAANLGIKVSAVCPGFVQSNMRQSNLALVGPAEKVYAAAESRIMAPMDTAEAARTFLQGVARYEALSVFPRHARVAWWLERQDLSLVNGTGSQAIRNFRRLRFQP